MKRGAKICRRIPLNVFWKKISANNKDTGNQGKKKQGDKRHEVVPGTQMKPDGLLRSLGPEEKP